MHVRRLLVLLAITALLLWGGVRVLRWLAIDSCLDRGGRWDYLADRCEEA